ncbi:precorrin-6Y C5,15-methyltransferase (decarboxylating) subunit CbiT [Actinomadura sp. 21ATH]|uniref:precorrin-6Y C5,15-methyltransferase (decarboxylating) subunit CbiT n=1 Tax=Actinomadura sp. 21ATH TaxID=1735444 RepID=UPI0035C003B5
MPAVPAVPGLPDASYDHDGQLTKREVRAITLARLAPVPGELLWDVGAGAGSVAIEWMRAHPECRAVAVEDRPERARRITANAAALGVPALAVVTGPAPAVLATLEGPPDAVFVGGGLTAPGMIATCWDALRPGGRLVANTVTVEGERTVLEAHGRLGGDLARIAVDRAAPLGALTTWRPQIPVLQWTATKPA